MSTELQKWLDEPKQIIKYPHPILTTPTSPVTEEMYRSPVFDTVCNQMFAMMHQAKGVGLAAPQVGLPYSFFVVNITNKFEKRRIFVNPIITWTSNRPSVVTEGCLSFPGVFADVARPKGIMLEYQSATRIEKSQFEGIFARVCQHELDHLYGTMFFDKIPPDEKLKLLGGKT